MTATTPLSGFAAEYQALFDEIIAFVERCPDDQWNGVTSAEGWSVGVVTHHIAMVQAFITDSIQNIAAGGTDLPQISMEQVHANNANHAHEYANASKAETLALLRAGTPIGVDVLRGLTDAQLAIFAGVFGGHEMTLAQVIEWVALGHFREHYASLQATIPS